MPKVKPYIDPMHFGRWLGLQLDLLAKKGGQLGRGKFGSLIDGESASRVSQWITGERAVLPEKAYKIGEVLNTLGSGEASGPIALYAAGYICELLRFLRRLPLSIKNDGPRRAVTLFCCLPKLMNWLDFDEGPEKRTLHPALAAELRDREAADIYNACWQEILRGDVGLDDSLLSIPFTEAEAARMREAAQALNMPVSKFMERAIVSDARRVLGFEDQEIDNWPSDAPPIGDLTQSASVQWDLMNNIDQASMLADPVIYYLEGDSDPNDWQSIKRAWRMLLEWAYETDYKTFISLADALPEEYLRIGGTKNTKLRIVLEKSS